MAAGVSLANPILPPQVLNSYTTYGQDLGVGNNYGMGPDYLSLSAIAQAQKATDAQPSTLWLIAFVVLAWWLL